MFSAILKADRELYILINSGLASPFFDKLMMVLSSTITWAVAALILLIFFTRRGRGPGLKASVYCAGVLIVTDSSAYHILKPVFARVRPCKEYIWARIVDGCAGFMSFPSNHATNSMAVTVFILVLAPPVWGVLAVLLALLVGFSRIYLGVHYPLDILGGYMYGALIATPVALYLRRRNGPESGPATGPR